MLISNNKEFDNIEQFMEDGGQKRVCVFTIHTADDRRVFNRQCRSLQKYGWSVTIIGISEEGTYDDNGIKVIGVEKWKSKWQRVKTVLRIAHIASRQKTDVYHFHDLDLLIPGVFLRLLTRKPVIYDIHEFYNINIPLFKLPNAWPIRQIASALIWLIETIAGTLCGCISAVHEDFIRRFSKLGCKTVYTPNFASIEDFAPVPVSDEEWEQRRKRVIFIGGLEPTRGSLILPDIAKQVKQRRPDIEFRVTRRYSAKYQEEAMMKKMALPGYRDVIQFVPNVSATELPKVVRQGGIGLSVCQETAMDRRGVPGKLFEYMSQAVPIVASNLPHSRKYVRDVGCGILVKPDSPEEYADAIIELVDNLMLAKEMGCKGQKAFAEKYNWGVVEKNLVQFYESICGQTT